MVVDASAVLAIYFGEPERTAFLDILTATDQPVMAPVNAWEVLARAQSAHGASGLSEAEALIAALGISVAASGLDDVRGAVAAFARYGRGTPAGLNLGDSFAYALAQKLQRPLLFKGDDFTKTDIARAG
jgi:ribonuclease VapC